MEREDALLLEELEVTRQDLHVARRRIETLAASIKHLESENAELNNELSEVAQKRQDSCSYDQGKNDSKYREQVTGLQLQLEEAQASEKFAKENVRKLEQQLKLALESAASAIPQNVDKDDDVIAMFQAQVSELVEEKNSLKLKLYESAMELKQNIEEVRSLKQELTEKEEEIECMGGQFTTQCDINQRMRDENCELRSQLESESAHVDPRKKGNSLFAEVDDRRVVAEQKIMKQESIIRELEEKLTKEQKENKRLKLQILLLRQTSSKGYDDNTVRTLQDQLLESKRLIIHLTEQSQKRDTPSKSKQEIKFPTFVEGAKDSDTNFIKFLQEIIKQKTKEAETANTLSQQNHLQALRTELHLTEYKNENTALTNDRDRLKTMNSHLTGTIQELQRKYEPELFAPPSKEMIKIPRNETVSISRSQNDNRKQNILKAKTGFAQDNEICQQKPSQNCVDVSGPAGGVDENVKENISQNNSRDLPGSVRGKSVRMLPQVNVVSSSDVQETEDLKGDGQGEKVKKVQKNGTGKYKSVTYVNMEAETSECKQQ